MAVLWKGLDMSGHGGIVNSLGMGNDGYTSVFYFVHGFPSQPFLAKIETSSGAIKYLVIDHTRR